VKLIILFSIFITGCSVAQIRWVEKNYETKSGIISYRTDLGFLDASTAKADAEVKNYCQSDYKIIAEGESSTFGGFVHNGYNSTAVNHGWNNIRFACIKQ
jgi:hypothetical protein